MRRRIDDDDEDCSSRRRGVGSAAVAVVSSSATRSGAVLPLSSPVLIAATARDATTTTVPNAPPRGTPIQPAAGGAANADRLKTDQSLAFRRVIGVDFWAPPRVARVGGRELLQQKCLDSVDKIHIKDGLCPLG